MERMSGKSRQETVHTPVTILTNVRMEPRGRRTFDQEISKRTSHKNH